MRIKFWISLLIVSIFIGNQGVFANINHSPKVQHYIDQLVRLHAFHRAYLEKIFSQVVYNHKVIKRVKKPYEHRPWFDYRRLFLTQERLNKGLIFWHQHAKILAKAQQRFGVPPSIIVALLGIETFYGRIQGHYRVINSLATLAFRESGRNQFFRRQLTQFLLMCREQHVNPFKLYGSYAGAFGQAQFMPGSFRRYAFSFTHPGKVDLINNVSDCIGSVANYFKAHGWQTNQPVLSQAVITSHGYQKLKFDNKPHYSLGKLAEFGIKAKNTHLSAQRKATLISLQLAHGSQHWLGFQNFYVITRYNPSKLYAMAVYQLSKVLRTHYQEKYTHHHDSINT